MLQRSLVSCVLLFLMATTSTFSSQLLHASEIITIAGTGAKPWTGADGPATKMNVSEPYGVVLGPDGKLYICEIFSSVIRQLDLQTGMLKTVAGCGKKGYAGDHGPATKAVLNEPYEVRFNSQGEMFFVEMKNHLVREVDVKTGIITTYAGTGETGFSGDGGPAVKATFNQPHSIIFDQQDNLYICDIMNKRVRMVDAKTGIVSTYLGGGKKPITAGSGIEDLLLAGPRAMDIDPQGNLLLALREGNKIFRLKQATQQFEHLAGVGGKNRYSGDGGDAKLATLAGPKGVAVDPEGNIYFADTESHTIRMILANSGIIKTVAGTGEKGNGPDGDPLKCKLNRPHSICCDAQGNVYIGDSENHVVRLLKIR